jgi:hypothetical protein
VIVEENEEVEYELEQSDEDSDNAEEENNEDYYVENATQITTAIATCDQNSAIIRRNDLPASQTLTVNSAVQNGDVPRKSAIKNSVAFQQNEDKKKSNKVTDNLPISFDKIIRHKKR